MRKPDIQNLDATAAKLRKEWMVILVRELAAEAEKRGIRDTGALIRSLHGKSSSTDVLEYLIYGAMVDMNVGRGRTLEYNYRAKQARLALGGKRQSRRARNHQWYSRRMGREVYILGKKMAELYADAGVDALIRAMPHKIELIK